MRYLVSVKDEVCNTHEPHHEDLELHAVVFVEWHFRQPAFLVIAIVQFDWQTRPSRLGEPIVLQKLGDCEARPRLLVEVNRIDALYKQE